MDASLGAKWYFDEEMREEADLFRKRLENREIALIVPEIFYPEMASVCRKKFQLREITSLEALEIFGEVQRLPLTKYSDAELADVALENALRFGISVYDGLYTALAELYVTPLVTADRELFEKCKDRFEFIEYLGDIKN